MTKTLYIDADTILYSSSAKEEIHKCKATNIKTGNSRLFLSKTKFNEWFAAKSKYSKADYSFEVIPELVGERAFVFSSIKKKIEHITEVANASGFTDIKICIQGEHNYRKDYKSDFVSYKGQRGNKPILFPEAYEWVKKRYAKQVIISDGEETDDVICKLAWEHYSPEITLDNCKVAFGFVDKDIVQNSPGVMLNYFHLEDNFFLNTREMQYRGFWGSVLTGDVADNIPGLEKLSNETKSQYGIKTSGVGKVAAGRILSGAETEKECADRVVEAYTLSWPDDWKQRLQDNCFFLYLRRKPNEMFTFDDYYATLS